MRVRPSGRTTQWGAGDPGPTHGWNTTWPFRSLASNWARASSSARVMARLWLLLSVFTTFMLFFPLRSVILKLRPVHRHTKTGRPGHFQVGPRHLHTRRCWVSVGVLWWFRPGASDLPRSCGWRARRTAGDHRRPSRPGTVTGSVLLHGVVTSLGWDFGGMGFRQPLLGSPSGHVNNASARR